MVLSLAEKRLLVERPEKFGWGAVYALIKFRFLTPMSPVTPFAWAEA
jgi:hypothetical protein